MSYNKEYDREIKHGMKKEYCNYQDKFKSLKLDIKRFEGGLGQLQNRLQELNYTPYFSQRINEAKGNLAKAGKDYREDLQIIVREIKEQEELIEKKRRELQETEEEFNRLFPESDV